MPATFSAIVRNARHMTMLYVTRGEIPVPDLRRRRSRTVNTEVHLLLLLLLLVHHHHLDRLHFGHHRSLCACGLCRPSYRLLALS